MIDRLMDPTFYSVVVKSGFEFWYDPKFDRIFVPLGTCRLLGVDIGDVLVANNGRDLRGFRGEPDLAVEFRSVCELMPEHHEEMRAIEARILEAALKSLQGPQEGNSRPSPH